MKHNHQTMKHKYHKHNNKHGKTHNKPYKKAHQHQIHMRHQKLKPTNNHSYQSRDEKKLTETPKTILPEHKSIYWWTNPVDTADDVRPKYEIHPNKLYYMINEEEQRTYYSPKQKK